jgi:hypothetical protein
MSGKPGRSLIWKEQNAWRARKRWSDPEYKASRSGSNHPAWKGGISANNAEYIRQHCHGGKTMKDNPKCAPWLGIYITERVLCQVFKDVVAMPRNNPGFDFHCANNYKIDAKASCIRKGKDGEYWTFSTNHNTGADYFACLAFDDRTSLTPLHFWLIPGPVVNDHKAFRISNSPTVLAKWERWERPLDKVLACCSSMREE